MDTPLHDLMIDTKYFHVDFPDAYAFITDLTGRVLIHPFLPLPANMDDDPVLTSIEAFIRNPSAVSFINDVIQSGPRPPHSAACRVVASFAAEWGVMDGPARSRRTLGIAYGFLQKLSS